MRDPSGARSLWHPVYLFDVVPFMRPIVVCFFDDCAKVEVGYILCELTGELRPGFVFRFIERLDRGPTR
jgi:hypothetical protein